MSIVIACRTEEGKIVFGSDGRTTYAESGCMPMAGPKYVETVPGKVILGFTGDCGHEAVVKEHYFSDGLDLMYALKAASLDPSLPKSKDHEGLDLEIIECSSKGIFLIGGDRSTAGPYQYIAAGKPSAISMATLDEALHQKRRKNSMSIRSIVKRALEAAGRYDGTVGAPYFVETFEV